MLFGLAVDLQSQNAMKFQSVNEEYGISLRETTSSCMDSNGFVWIASKMGVLRVTADDHRIYQLPYNSPDVIFVKLHFANGTLFVYSNNGQVFVYNPVLDRFELHLHLGQELNDPYLMIYNMEVDEADRMWFSSPRALFKCVGKTVTELTQFENVRYLTIDGPHMWVSAGERLMVFDVYGSGKGEVVYHSDTDMRVSKLFVDSKGVVWIGTEGRGLFRFDQGVDTLQSVPNFPRQPILGMDAVSDSVLLVGVDGQGLWEVDRNSLRVNGVHKEDVDNNRSLRGNGVYDVFNDGHGRVWVCTFSGGASYFMQLPASVQHVEHHVNESNSLINNDVNGVLEDSRGDLWVATNNGISRWNRSEDKWQSLYHNRQEGAHVFLSLNEDASGNIWAGTYGGGVYVIDGTSGVELAHYSEKQSDDEAWNNYIYDIFRDTKDWLWLVGVRGDVLCYKPDEASFFNYGTHPVNVIEELPSGDMLLGCSYGISVLNLESGNVQILLNGYLVQDLLVQDSTYWLCTVGDGLVRYDFQADSVVSFSTEEGLPSAFVNSIQERNGVFWLGTENGLCAFDPLTQKVETFPAIEVLSRQSFNRNAYATLQNGELAFGSNRGMVVFNPDHLTPLEPDGRIFIQDINVSGRSVRDGFVGGRPIAADSIRELKLRHSHNTLSLEMLPLGVVFGPRFSWKLEGFDADWHQPGDNRVLYYSNLPTGTFQLKLRMYDNTMSEVIDERIIDVVKTPPFWGTWWFLLLIASVLVGGYVLVMRYYMGLVRQLHSEQKIRFFANTAHDMRTSLTLIAGPVKELEKEALSEKGQYYLGLARSQVDRLVGVVTQLMDFQKVDLDKEQVSLQRIDFSALVAQRVTMFDSYAQSNELRVHLEAPGSPVWVNADEGMMVKIVDNLLSNAVKYSRAGTVVHVRLKIQKKSVVLEVEDQGIGIDKEARGQLFQEFYRGANAINSRVVGSGIGLLLTQRYLKLHGGSIDWKSEVNKGSLFTVSLPQAAMGEPQEGQSELPSQEFPALKALPQSERIEGAFSVMVVEDNRELQEFIKVALQDRFEVNVADDGNKGWGEILRELPDLVVSDVLMPGKDGFELCRLIKSTYETAHIPVILLTALSGEADQLHGFGLGADDYITKPFDVELLSQKIATIIRNRRLVSERLVSMPVDTPAEPLLANEINDAFLKRAREVVEEHLPNSAFNKDLFAAEMNVSGSLLYKKIKSLTGQSPSDFIRSVRLGHSVDLLRSGSYTITEVSELCGFTSVGYFSTVFKKHYKRTPSEMLPR